MNIAQLLISYADGQLNDTEECAIEARLDDDPSLRGELALLYRERLMLAEFLLEQKAQNDTSYAVPRVVATPKTCDFCETADTSSFEILPNEEIFTDYVSGRLSRDECDDVEKQLADDKLLEQEFAAFCRNRFLFAEAARSQKSVVVRGNLQAAQSKYKRRLYQSEEYPSYVWLKIAALFVAILGGAWFLSRFYQSSGDNRVAIVNETRPAVRDVTPIPVDVSPSENYIAAVTELVGKIEIYNRPSGTVVAETKTRIMDGDEIRVRAGMVTIKFDSDNSTITLRGRSRASLGVDQSVTTVVLSKGMLAAAIEKQGSGEMIFKTPHARMDVLGTQFLLATSGDNTSLEMSKGSVRMSHAGTGQAKTVKAGEYAVASSKTLTTGTTGLEVLGFTLTNTDTMQPIHGYDPISPGGTIHLSRLDTESLTIAVNTMPLLVDRVDLRLSGPKGFATLKQTERYFPYLLTENMSISHWVDTSSCEPISPPLIPGKYSLTVTVQGKDDGVSKQITRSLSFTVVN